MPIARCLPFLAPWLLLSTAAGDESLDPRYAGDGALMAPLDYREWVFLSSGLDMSYSAGEAKPDHSMFDNVFVNPAAWAAFKQSGRWPDKTVFVMETRGAASKGSINQSGHFQTEELMGMEYHVRDDAKFKGGWAFFAADGGEPAKLIPSSESCYSCHLAHGAVQTTFSQFYPTAKPIAVKAGTYREK